MHVGGNPPEGVPLHTIFINQQVGGGGGTLGGGGGRRYTIGRNNSLNELTGYHFAARALS